MGGEVITGIIEKHNTIEAKKFFSQIHEKWSFCDFYNRNFFFSLPPMLLLVGVALALADWCAIQGRTPLQKKLPPRIPVQKYPIRKYGTKNHLSENTPSQTLRMWSCTGNPGRSSSVDLTPYVVLHEESWLKTWMSEISSQASHMRVGGDDVTSRYTPTTTERKTKLGLYKNTT